MKKKQESCELCFTESSKRTKATVKVYGKEGWEDIIVLACDKCMKDENLVKFKTAKAA